MSILLIGDCLDELKDIQENSVDLIFCDLPYGQTSCKWDCIIPIDKLWIEFMRIKKLNTPIIMTTTTKFGLSLLNSCPKKCPFRYDLIWCKSAPCGFLSAKKMPMRKHEMIYVFYEKLPFYDLSSHTHKFLDSKNGMKGQDDLCYGKEVKQVQNKKYDPPLPTSLIKEDEDYDKRVIKKRNTIKKEENYGKGYLDKKVNFRKYDPTLGGKGAPSHLYDPPLPTSLIKEDVYTISDNTIYGNNIKTINPKERKKGEPRYEPPLPTSLVKEDVYNANDRFKNGKLKKNPRHLQKGDDPIYDPPLPNSLLEIKSTRGKHSTEKPVALMEWILKYYSKEGDVVLDPTMGSGSMGVACKNMKRNFIGIEKDEEIYEVAVNRINPE